MERKIMLEAMMIFVMSAVIYGLIGERNLAMLLFWNIFAYMLIEDYRYQTVDLRSVIMLILFSGVGTESLKKYLIALVIGLVIFRVLSLLTTKIYNANEIFVGKSIVRSGHGYLPSLGAGILIYLLLEKVFGVPECVSAVVTGYKEIFEIVCQVNELLVGLIIVFVGLWLMLEWRVRKAAAGNSSSSNNNYSVGELAKQGAMANMMNVTSKMFEDAAKIGNTITVEPGYEFQIYVKEDLKF